MASIQIILRKQKIKVLKSTIVRVIVNSQTKILKENFELVATAFKHNKYPHSKNKKFLKTEINKWKSKRLNQENKIE